MRFVVQPSNNTEPHARCDAASLPVLNRRGGRLAVASSSWFTADQILRLHLLADLVPVHGLHDPSGHLQAGVEANKDKLKLGPEDARFNAEIAKLKADAKAKKAAA